MRVPGLALPAAAHTGESLEGSRLPAVVEAKHEHAQLAVILLEATQQIEEPLRRSTGTETSQEATGGRV